MTTTSIDHESRNEIRLMRAQIAQLVEALNQANAKLGLPAIQLPKAPLTF